MLRKVFLDELPRNKSTIDWCNSVGMKVKFVYDDIEGEIEIKEIINRLKIVAIYNDKEYCLLGQIISLLILILLVSLGQVI